MDLNTLSKEELITLVEIYAKNWLAIDGTWFLAVEEAEGMEKAIEYDIKSWERFTIVEANRIMKEFAVAKGSGLEGLKKALEYRVYSCLNVDSAEIKHDKLVYTMNTCRVQSARERKNLALFPCKQVGIVEYSGFAQSIDPRIRTRCIAAPPDDLEREYHCAWEFSIVDNQVS
ncbi:MAG: hypothetical protein INQ03_17780 [Candidatus Heimdallarchaeota archaeon]|nr:hypothetical protein [Candidatus Heimdallarchaeota archaeon]